MALTTDELHEIQECEKIVHFRDAVLSGTHPRIKVPAHLLGKPSNATRHGLNLNSLTPRQNLQATSQNEAPSDSPSINTNDEIALFTNKSSNVQRVTMGKPTASVPKMPKAVKSEINPILLEKSDDLIKAEIQLQRQRLERALRDQIEQRRISVKASLQTSESLPEFDISEVLSRALTIVHPSMANEAEQTVGDHASAASDSFDEKTLYSSQHDTSEQSITSQEHHEPAQVRFEDTATANAGSMEHDHMTHDKSGYVVMADNLPNVDTGEQEVTQDKPLLRQFSQNSNYSNPPGLNIITTDVAQLSQEGAYQTNVIESSGSKQQVAADVAINMHSEEMSGLSSKTPDELADLGTVQTGALLKRKFCEPLATGSAQLAEPAIIRARDDLSPIAPQPARVSPLATARAPPIIEQSIITNGPLAGPVSTLLKASDVSSRDSSPKGAKLPKTRNTKRPKKNKGKQVAADNTPDSPYIKPEPQSQSPLGIAPLPRPHKRQRQTLQQGSDLNYDEPRYEALREPQGLLQRIEPPRYGERVSRPIYEVTEDERIFEPHDSEPSGYQVRRDENQGRRIVSQDAYKGPRSPVLYAHSTEVYPVRAASHSITERHIRDPQRYHRESYIPARVAIRSNGDDEKPRSPIIIRDRRSPILMGPPPRIAPTRIIVDEYGGQYYAPTQAPISRQSVAPAIRPGGEDIVYERYGPPSTTFSRQSVVPAPRPNEEDLAYEHFPQARALASSRQSVAPARRPGDEDVYERYAPARPPVSSRQSVARSTRPREDDIIYERYAPTANIISSRQSVAPSVRPGDDDVIYERAIRRPLAGPPAEIYEDDGILYRRSPPSFSAPRRIISQAEPETNYQAYRQREYSVRPVTMAPPDEYVRVREPLERRQTSIKPIEPEVIRREYLPAADGYVTTRPIGRRAADRAEYVERVREVSYDPYTDDIRREIVHR